MVLDAAQCKGGHGARESHVLAGPNGIVKVKWLLVWLSFASDRSGTSRAM